MRGYIGTDDILTLTAPAGGVTADVPVRIGELVVVPIVNAQAGDSFAGRRRGVVELPKANVAVAEGEAVNWSTASSSVVKANVTGFGVGHVVKAAMASDARVRVVLTDRSEVVA